MPFNSLLLTAIIPERKLYENQAGIKIETVNDDECVVLFSADKCKYFHETFLKDIFRFSLIPSCCDAVCFSYKKNPRENKPPKLTITLIELKGGGRDYFKKASDQIILTRNGIEKGISKIVESENLNNINWKAIVVYNSQLSSGEVEDRLKDLRGKFGKNVIPITANGSYNDISKYIF